MAKAKPRQTSSAPEGAAATIATDLSYNEAQAALQLTLAALQANDLDVEAMTGLYRRARGYIERCEAVLASVEHELLLWDDTTEAAGLMPDSP